LSRNSIVAMMRGVSCPLATWIATSSDPKVNTRKDSASVMTVPYIACAPDCASAPTCQSSHSSRRRMNGATRRTRTMAISGTDHNADLR
jgi:hypothetical protein